LQAEIDDKTPIRDEKNELLEEKEELADHVSETIDEIDEDKEELDEWWSADQEEHDRATYVIERAKETIQNGFGTSFLQKGVEQTVMVQLSEHFKIAKNFKKQAWNKIFKMLSEISMSSAIQVDYGAVQKILTLIDALLEKIAESREIDRRSYEFEAGWLADLRSTNVELLVQTEQTIDLLQGEIAALNKRLEVAKSDRDEQKERSKDKGVELLETVKQCDDEGDAYFERRQDRADNLRTISDAIGLIESKLRILKEFVKQRLG
jgi:hypothetical protein